LIIVAGAGFSFSATIRGTIRRNAAWSKARLDPTVAARALWPETHLLPVTSDVSTLWNEALEPDVRTRAADNAEGWIWL
jgi:hypothetical protein